MRRYSTLFHPCSAEVGLIDDAPQAITLTLGEGDDVELWPGAEDHHAQEAWLEAVEKVLGQARA
ncbi:hypothetical protein [Allosalinactinospora lopnorensis]|uniref:hypothetical protein n=1 Tax=Allosalinactinospora lopnorensis TaxID=1352348 RepID=UPI0012E0D0A7|nr:hypothetical protein [Allosalinactinospora lopnorensis]